MNSKLTDSKKLISQRLLISLLVGIVISLSSLSTTAFGNDIYAEMDMSAHNLKETFQVIIEEGKCHVKRIDINHTSERIKINCGYARKSVLARYLDDGDMKAKEAMKKFICLLFILFILQYVVKILYNACSLIGSKLWRNQYQNRVESLRNSSGLSVFIRENPAIIFVILLLLFLLIPI